jgi:hypothetical protein
MAEGEGVKIIKKGEVPEHKTYRVDCHNCKTEFEFLANEATITRDPRDGDFLTIECPLCGVSVHCGV